MRSRPPRSKRLSFQLSLFISCILLSSSPVFPCTIFTLIDSVNVLFCNNEDWKDPNTRIWFIPATDATSSDEHEYGCAFVGFSNQWGQGGINTQGLAYDWVAGFNATWERDDNPSLKRARGNPAEQMLKSCASVEEAIAFYKEYWEPGFSYARILIADSTGTSVIIGAREGHLEFDISEETRGFGYGIREIEQELIECPEATLADASQILQKALQPGEYATKYSNVFDLRTGDIFIYQDAHQTAPVKLKLLEELEKGEHYYDIPEIEEQMTQKIRPISQLKEWLKGLIGLFY